VHLDSSQLADQIGQITAGIRTLALAFLLLGMLLGSALAAQADASAWGFIPLVASFLFFGTLAASTLVALRIMRALK
jgi:hypothetical protein